MYNWYLWFSTSAYGKINKTWKYKNFSTYKIQNCHEIYIIKCKNNNPLMLQWNQALFSSNNGIQKKRMTPYRFTGINYFAQEWFNFLPKPPFSENEILFMSVQIIFFSFPWNLLSKCCLTQICENRLLILNNSHWIFNLQTTSISTLQIQAFSV